MFVKLSSAIVACAIAIASSPAIAQQINRMPDNVRADIYRRVCLANKNNGLSSEEMLQYTENWLTRNANFEPTGNLSKRELNAVKESRKTIILQQANDMLREVTSDGNCLPVRYY